MFFTTIDNAFKWKYKISQILWMHPWNKNLMIVIVATIWKKPWQRISLPIHLDLKVTNSAVTKFITIIPIYCLEVAKCWNLLFWKDLLTDIADTNVCIFVTILVLKFEFQDCHRGLQTLPNLWGVAGSLSRRESKECTAQFSTLVQQRRQKWVRLLVLIFKMCFCGGAGSPPLHSNISWKQA